MAEPAVLMNEIQFTILRRFPNPKMIKAGEQIRVTNEDLSKILTDNGERLPKFPSHAVSRWIGWTPSFRTTLAGAALVIRAMNDYSVPEAPGVTEPKIRIDTKAIKPEELDPDYYHWPEEAAYVETMMKHNANIYFSGPTGCGKTEMFIRLFNKMGSDFHRVNFDGEFSKSDFVGDWVLDSTEASGTKMVYNDGVLPRAMKEGIPLLLDEYDAAPAEILFTLQSVLEGKPLYNTRRPEKVVPKEGFMIVATANTVGKGDMSSLYAGTRLMNEANLNRFHYVLRMGYPKQDVERAIVMKRTGAPQEMVQKIVEFMAAARKAAADGEL